MEKVYEGKESGEFWAGVKGSWAEYERMTAGDLSLSASPQLYHMTSVLGSFEVNMVKCEYRKAGLVNNLMVDQSLLYEAEQPGNSSLQFSPPLLTPPLQPCSCWTVECVSTSGKAGSPRTLRLVRRPQAAGESGGRRSAGRP